MVAKNNLIAVRIDRVATGVKILPAVGNTDSVYPVSGPYRRADTLEQPDLTVRPNYFGKALVVVDAEQVPGNFCAVVVRYAVVQLFWQHRV